MEKFLEKLKQECLVLREASSCLMSGQALKAEALVIDEKSTSGPHSVLYAAVAYLKASLTMNDGDLRDALSALSDAEKVIASDAKERRKQLADIMVSLRAATGAKDPGAVALISNGAAAIGSLFKGKSPGKQEKPVLSTAELEEHQATIQLAEKCDTLLEEFFSLQEADCAVMNAVLLFFQESLMSYIRGGRMILRAFKIYDRSCRNHGLFRHHSGSQEHSPSETSLNELQHESDKLDFLRVEIESNACFGGGLMYIAVAMLPSKIRKLLETFGLMQGNRETGLSLMCSGLERSEAIRMPFILMSFLCYRYIMPTSYGALYSHGLPDISQVSAWLHPQHAFLSHKLAQRSISLSDDILKTAINKFPDGTLFLWVHGRALRENGDHNAAIELFQRGADNADNAGMTQMQQACLQEMAWSFACQAKYESAAEAFENALNENSWSAGFTIYLIIINHIAAAVLHKNTNASAEALKWFDKLNNLYQRKKSAAQQQSTMVETFAFHKLQSVLSSHQVIQDIFNDTDEASQYISCSFPLFEALYLGSFFPSMLEGKDDVLTQLEDIENSYFVQQTQNLLDNSVTLGDLTVNEEPSAPFHAWFQQMTALARRPNSMSSPLTMPFSKKSASNESSTVLKPAFWDNYAKFCLWKALLLRDVERYTESRAYFHRLFSLEGLISQDSYILPFGQFEYAVLFVRLAIRSLEQEISSEGTVNSTPPTKTEFPLSEKDLKKDEFLSKSYARIARQAIENAQNYSSFDCEDRLQYKLQCLSETLHHIGKCHKTMRDS